MQRLKQARWRRWGWGVGAVWGDRSWVCGNAEVLLIGYLVGGTYSRLYKGNGELLNAIFRNLSLGIGGSLVLAACGSATKGSNTVIKASPGSVYSILTTKTAQVVQEGSKATFTITALSMTAAPVAGVPVEFYVGQMVPLSGVGVKSWFASGTASANRFVLSASRSTDRAGKATLVLRGMPSNTMEMIGVKAGDLSTYSSASGSLGSMDAWWTTAGASPAAPVGDYVTVAPFATRALGMSQRLSVLVSSPQGPVSGAMVSVAPKAGGMGGTSAMVPPTPMLYKTAADGITSMSVQVHTMTPIRVVVTQGASAARVAGGMNALLEG